MILIYFEKPDASPYEDKLVASLGSGVHLRTARLWRGETEEGTQLVYTNDERIKAAYEAKGVSVKPITKAARAPAKKVPAKRPVRTPKKAPAKRKK